MSQLALPNYLSWKQQARSLELAAFSGQTLAWTGAEYPERLEALAATEQSFLSDTGGAAFPSPLLPADEGQLGRRPGRGAEQPVVARTGSNADPRVVGRQLILNGSPYSIIGAASARMSVPSRTRPVGAGAGRRTVGAPRQSLSVGDWPAEAWLAPRDQAQADMSTIGAGLAQAYPDSNRDYGVSVTPFADSLVSDEIRTALVVLLAAATIVLLIACGNVANVLLSRADEAAPGDGDSHSARRRRCPYHPTAHD